jgi:hypothetical protein
MKCPHCNKEIRHHSHKKHVCTQFEYPWIDGHELPEHFTRRTCKTCGQKWEKKRVPTAYGYGSEKWVRISERRN